MKKLAIAAAALMLAGCTTTNSVFKKSEGQPLTIQKKQIVNQNVDAPATFKKRWMPKFKIKWLHSK